MMKKLLIPVTSGVMLLASCQKDIKVSTPQQPPRLVLLADYTMNDSINVRLEKAVSIQSYKQSTDLTVSNATVQLFDNDQFIDTLKYDPNLLTYVSNHIAQEGHNYTLSLSAPGFETAEAKALAQPSVKMTSIQHNKAARKDANGNVLDELVIKFTDPAGNATDHYRIKLWVQQLAGTEPSQISTCIESSDPSIESISDGFDESECVSINGAVYLNDKLFNGKEKELHLFVEHNSLGNDNNYPFTVELEHLSDEYYRYLMTKEYASQNNGNPFAEPTNVFTNVKNGYGIFSIIGVSRKEVQ